MYRRDYIKKWEWIGIVAVYVIFTILHNAVEWSGITWMVYIGAANESLWEHLKIAFYAYFIYSFLEYIIVGREYHGYWYGKAIGSLVLLVMILVLYSTYFYVIGYDNLWANLFILLVALIGSFYVSYKSIQVVTYRRTYQWIFFVAMLIGIGVFTYFTLYPLHIPLFYDPYHDTYGIAILV